MARETVTAQQWRAARPEMGLCSRLIQREPRLSSTVLQADPTADPHSAVWSWTARVICMVRPTTVAPTTVAQYSKSTRSPVPKRFYTALRVEAMASGRWGYSETRKAISTAVLKLAGPILQG